MNITNLQLLFLFGLLFAVVGFLLLFSGKFTGNNDFKVGNITVGGTTAGFLAGLGAVLMLAGAVVTPRCIYGQCDVKPTLEVETASKKPKDQQITSRDTNTTVSQSIAGSWAYYEVSADGGATVVGQLEPIPTPNKWPNFSNIKQGQILKTLSEVNLRSEPTAKGGASTVIATLAGGSCVIVVEDANAANSPKLTDAASGGWLKISLQHCP